MKFNSNGNSFQKWMRDFSLNLVDTWFYSAMPLEKRFEHASRCRHRLNNFYKFEFLFFFSSFCFFRASANRECELKRIKMKEKKFIWNCNELIQKENYLIVVKLSLSWGCLINLIGSSNENFLLLSFDTWTMKKYSGKDDSIASGYHCCKKILTNAQSLLVLLQISWLTHSFHWYNDYYDKNILLKFAE
jgi:hypothetical protein